MSNHIAKKEKGRTIDLNELRRAWIKRKEEFFQDMEVLGYASMSTPEFLALIPTAQMTVGERGALKKLQEKYHELAESQDILWVEERVTQELNKKHAAIHTDQFYVLTTKPNPILKIESFKLESKESFKSTYENKLVMCPDGVQRSKAMIWLKSPLRREYNGIVFDPITDPRILEEQRLYNIWKGFSYKPIQGDVSRYWDHVRDNICSGDTASYRYVRKWAALVFQRPDNVRTALVLCGSQGVGKNSFVNPLGKLMGCHYAPLSNISELISHFNAHLTHAVLIHANEALWGGHRKDLGTLKSMITEDMASIEAKGKDRIFVKNHRNLVVSSNEDWPVHLDHDDRRFFVLNVSSARKEDHEYFRAIDEQMQQGGYEALLYDLLHEDVSTFNPRCMPQSTKAFDLKLLSATSAQLYVYEVLMEGRFGIGAEYSGENTPGYAIGNQGVWQLEIPRPDLFRDYMIWCRSQGHKSEPDHQFGKSLKKIIHSIGERRRSIGGNQRVRVYVFPSLEECRKEFCAFFKAPSSIWDADQIEK